MGGVDEVPGCQGADRCGQVAEEVPFHDEEVVGVHSSQVANPGGVEGPEDVGLEDRRGQGKGVGFVVEVVAGYG
jgi:hypothetical protein